MSRADFSERDRPDPCLPGHSEGLRNARKMQRVLSRARPRKSEGASLRGDGI